MFLLGVLIWKENLVSLLKMPGGDNGGVDLSLRLCQFFMGESMEQSQAVGPIICGQH